MKKRILIAILFAWCCSLLPSRAQMFSDGYWREQTMVMGKWSQLFYELNVGGPVGPKYERSANFIYVSLGYGKPNTKNAWRKFLPKSKQAAPTSKDEMLNRQDDNTSGLHAGTIGIGWQHFCNHWIGFHMQAGWAFIGDFGTRDDDSTVSSSDEEEGSKSTFIYNSVPIQAGLDINLWHHWNISVGATYMWKEIPIITIGTGFVF